MCLGIARAIRDEVEGRTVVAPASSEDCAAVRALLYMVQNADGTGNQFNLRIKLNDAQRARIEEERKQDRLARKATTLSLEEQQKLCIARLLPTKPSVLLMDEPCSALDPEATSAVEDLIWDLRGHYSILIVTHNMAQARRASDECVFMLMGKVVEHTETEDMFVAPQKQETSDYIEGRFG